MAGNTPKVSVLLELVDKMTQPLNGAGAAVKGFGGKLKSLGSEAADLMRNKLFQGVGLAGLVAGMRGAVNAANDMEASVRKLAGTAKITGVPLEFLEQVAGKARDQFKLSAVMANDFAAEMAKLASKAGDVGLAAPALQAFLDIGAARGLSAAESLKAVEQAIIGTDEGTDKLFNKNPSVLYAEFADKIGTTAGKLSDQQKAQALLNAAMEDGQKVQGAYGDYLNSAAGKQEQLNIAIKTAAIEFGTALLPAVEFLTPAITKATGVMGVLVKVVQQAGVNVGVVFFNILDGLAGMAKTIFNIVTLDFKGAFDAAKTTLSNIRNNVAGAWIATKEIWSDGADSVTGTETDFQALLTSLRKEGNKERTEEDKKAAEAQKRRLDALNEDILVKQLMFERNLTEQQAKALLQRQRDLGDASAQQVRTVSEAYNRLDALNTLLAAGFSQRVTPAVKMTTQHLETLGHHAEPVAVEVKRVGTAAEDTGDDLERNARTAVDAAHGMGLLDDAGKGVVTTMINLGGAIKDAIAGGWSTGGIIGVVAGVGSLLKGLFGGKSPAQIAAERALRKNTEVIQDNTRQVGDLTRLQTAGGRLAGAESALAGFLGSDLAKFLGPLGRTLGGQQSGQQAQLALVSALSAAGLSISDLDRIAGDLGISIRDSEGRLDSRLLQQLLDLLRQIEPTQFAETFAGRLAALREETALFDLNPIEQAQRLVALAGGPLGAGIIGERLGGLDFTTAEGRAAGVAAIQQLFRDLPGLTASDLGGLTGSQFLDVLSDLKDLLTTDLPAAVTTGVTEAVGDGGLGEVAPTTDAPAPSVSLADLVMTATRSEQHLADIATFTSRIPEWIPDPATRTGVGRGNVHMEIGPVHITAPPGAGGQELADEFVNAINARLGDLYRLDLLARGSAEIPR